MLVIKGKEECAKIRIKQRGPGREREKKEKKTKMAKEEETEKERADENQGRTTVSDIKAQEQRGNQRRPATMAKRPPLPRGGRPSLAPPHPYREKNKKRKRIIVDATCSPSANQTFTRPNHLVPPPPYRYLLIQEPRSPPPPLPRHSQTT